MTTTSADPSKTGLIGAGALMRLLWPVRGHLVLCTFLSVLGSAAGLVPYIAIAEIARTMIGSAGSAPDKIWNMVYAGIAGALLRPLLLFASSRLGHYADAELLHRIRVRIVHHLGVLPLGWFREKGSAAVKKSMTNDLEEMHQLIAHALGELVGAATSIGTALGYLFFIDWRMALITVAVLLALYISFQIAMRSVTTHMNRLLAAEQRISAASVEYADGIDVVKTFGTGGRLLDRFQSAVQEYKVAMQTWVAETKYSTSASHLFASEVTLLGVLMITGILFVANGSLPVSDLLPFLVVGIGLPTAIVPAVHGAQGIRKGRLSASNIERLLLTPPIIETSLPLRLSDYDLVFEDVSFSYGKGTPAVAQLHFKCEKGTVTALVGPSGAGKTTIANLIPRFYDVTGGAIKIGGTDIRKITAQELLSSLSLVFQDVVLLRDTVAENIRIGKQGATDAEVEQAAKAAQIHQVIERLPMGYKTLLGTDGAGLSGGERQRITIARAILSEAPIVVLDEATASLDADNEVAVQKALAELMQQKTVIVIAHRLNTIQNADQIIVLDRGRIAEKGTHRELLAQAGLYSKLWQAQFIPQITT